MPKPLKLDLGAGKAVAAGYEGVDIIAHKGVKHVVDLRHPWPWKDASVDEAHSRHLLHYFTPAERIHFVNELHRVLKPGAKTLFIVPHWAANQAYGDLGVQWPPIAESWLFRLNKEWREANAYWETQYTCDFDFTCGYGMHAAVTVRHEEYQREAIMWWKEAAQETYATLTKRGE